MTAGESEQWDDPPGVDADDLNQHSDEDGDVLVKDGADAESSGEEITDRQAGLMVTGLFMATLSVWWAVGGAYVWSATMAAMIGVVALTAYAISVHAEVS